MPHDPEAKRARAARHRAECRDVITAAKAQPCADCGQRYPYYVMDFDHVLPGKTGNVGDLAGRYSVDRLKAEITLCEVVCANCHRERTYTRSLV